jgi:troponin I
MSDFASDMEDTDSGFLPCLEEESVRYGGPMTVNTANDDDEEEDDEDKRRNAERERKKAEVRKRLEEAGRMKKAKKGFLTPERKKKLRKLLMLKAAEDLKQQQMLKEQERQRILQERIPSLPDNLDGMDEDELREVYQEFYDHIVELESNKYDLSYDVRQKDFEINELTIAVNDLRGKFVKPTLKKVSNTDNKFNKLKKKAAPTVDFRSNLKTVETNKFGLEEEKATEKVDWSK